MGGCMAVTFNPQNRLHAENLACLRGDLLLFEALDLQVEAGQLLQIEGPNGSGKTSLLRMLAGLSLAEEGEVCWNDIPVRRQRADYALALHYIGHQAGLKTSLTVTENLRFAVDFMGGTNISPALESMNMTDHADQHAYTLSAGQQRRSALARLLLRPAPLWILDEPFTALDHAGVELVTDLIKSHLDRGGLVIMTSHQPVAVPQRRRLQLVP